MTFLSLPWYLSTVLTSTPVYTSQSSYNVIMTEPVVCPLTVRYGLLQQLNLIPKGGDHANVVALATGLHQNPNLNKINKEI